MIPINTAEARKAFQQKKINMWELTFIEGVHKEESITEKQYETILAVAHKMKPLVLINEAETAFDPYAYRQPIDPYYNDSYFK